MLAVPRYQKITPVIRRSGKVQRVASGISGHKSVGNVGIDDLGNRFVKIEEGEPADQGHRFLPRRIIPVRNSASTARLVTSSSPDSRAASNHRRVQLRRATISAVERTSK
jgi:hypothetical protein